MGSVAASLLRAAVVAAGCAGAVPALAQPEPPTEPQPQRRPPTERPHSDTQIAKSPPRPTIAGEQERTRLKDRGIDLSLSYGSETAWNVRGGERERVRETGQFTFGATLDMETLAGIEGGTFQGTVTYRRGYDLGEKAGLGVLQQVQEVFGRGQTWRLTQFWYQQEFEGSGIDLKFGRLTMGEDFAAFSCEFMNLTFCGSQPGNIVGDYWFNWPVSQWAARLRVEAQNDLYVQAGVFEVNPKNLENDFTIGHFEGATGVLLPLEVGWTPALGANRLPGTYKVGGWYNTAGGDDVFLDVNREPQPVTGAPPLSRSGRYGGYVMVQQQVTGRAEEARTISGLTLFLNLTQADRKTSRIDNQVSAGLFYTGLLQARPEDVIGFAVGRTNVNARAERDLPGPRQRAEKPGAEYASELYYGFHVAEWLILQPNVQYIINPGGFDHNRDIVVFGLKANLVL